MLTDEFTDDFTDSILANHKISQVDRNVDVYLSEVRSREDNLKDGEEFVLKHHGVKGMKWGVSRGRAAGGSDVSVSEHNIGGHAFVRTKGGGGNSAHNDAIESKVVRQKMKRSGMNSLSNEELQTYNNRMNLESNARRLTREKHQQTIAVIKTTAKTAKTVHKISKDPKTKQGLSFIKAAVI